MSELNLYNDWVEEIYAGNDEEREAIINSAIERVSKNQKTENLINSFMDDDEFKKPSVLAFLLYVPMNEKQDGSVKHVTFKHPMIMKTHKRLPMTMGIGCKLEGGKWLPIEEVKNAMNVKQLLGFVDRLSRMDKDSKKRLLDKTYEGLEFYRNQKEGKESLKKIKEESIWLSDLLRSNKEFELVGFAANYPYINLDSKYGDTEPFWVHPWGPGQLLFSHRTIPAILIVGPSQREDENVLGQTNMVGKTG